MLTGPRTSATYPSLRLSTRRFWNSEHVMATVHPTTSPTLSFVQTSVGGGHFTSLLYFSLL